MNRQAIASALGGGGKRAPAAPVPVSEEAGFFSSIPSGEENWLSAYAPGKIITQSELDSLQQYAIDDKRAKYEPLANPLEGIFGPPRAPNPGAFGLLNKDPNRDYSSFYIPDPGAGQNAARGLNYTKAYTPIPGLDFATSNDNEGNIVGNYTVDGKPVEYYADDTGRGFREMPENATPWLPNQEPPKTYAITETGDYRVVKGNDRYEKDIVNQWVEDAKPEGGFFSQVMPMVAGLALSFVLGPQMALAFGGGPIGAAASGAITGGMSSAISGGDPLKGALSGGISSGLGSYLGAADGLLPKGSSTFNDVARGAITGGVSGAIRGNGLAGAVSGAVGGAIPGNDFGSSLLRAGAQAGAGYLLNANKEQQVGSITDSATQAPAAQPSQWATIGASDASNMTARQRIADAIKSRSN